MKYHLTKTGIVRESDNANIPADSGNSDWQEFLEWKKKGGTPHAMPPTGLIHPALNWATGVWSESAPQSELDSIAERAAHKAELKSKLTALTPAQINTYIDTNVTDMAGAKVYLKRLTLVVRALALNLGADK